MDLDIERRIGDLITGAERRISAALDTWIMYVSWRNLTFVSWPVPVDVLRPLVPAPLEIDTFNGSGWVSVVPFGNADAHFRDLPPLPGQASFAELNLRTYIRLPGDASVYFLSLDATSLIADLIGKAFHLPFYRADMSVDVTGTTASYTSHRVDQSAPPADLVMTSAISGSPAPAPQGSLASFLTERLTLVVSIDGVLHHGVIHHDPWMLQPAAVTIDTNTLAAPFNLDLSGPPVHTAFAPRTDTLIWPLTRLSL
jgi:uncharacterized protein YqjF (DUF2071 family)